VRAIRYLVFVLFFVSSASAAPVSSAQSAFDQARDTFQKLQQSDPEVKDLLAWERAAAKLQKFTTDFANSGFTPDAFFLLGRLYEQTAEHRSFRTGVSKAVYYYERLAKDYQGNAKVPEALLHLGDLRRNQLKDEPAARSAYYEIIDRYGKSPVAATARIRLGLPEEAPANAQGKKTEKTEVAAAAAPASTPVPESGFLGKLFSSTPNVGEGGKEIYTSENTLHRPLIVIDPGHGGEELGATGVRNVLEKDVVLNISLYLEELLRERLRAKTVLTRTKDTTLSLADRTKIANDQGADLFISVHANASEYKNVKGIETYYLDNTDDKSSLKLATRENASLQRSGTDLGFIISDFIQSAKLDESISLAHHLQKGLNQSLSRYYEGIKDLGVKKAPFYVLVGAHMPCVLVEVSFIDHPSEGARLITQRYQRIAALGIYQGIKDYFEQRVK